MVRRFLSVVALVMLVGSCGEDAPKPHVSGVSAGSDSGGGALQDAAATGDGSVHDTVAVDSGTPDTTAKAPDAETPVTFSPGPTPSKRMWPVKGELFVMQVGVNSLIPKMGEAAIVVGPDGSIALVDVGNDKHAKMIRERVEELNTKHLTTANGYPQRGKRQVEWIVLTHWHADHVGALSELLDGDDKLTVTRAVVHRGWADVGDGTNGEHYEAGCALLRGKLSHLDAGLCAAKALPPCDAAKITDNAPAVHCDGLLRGELGNASDDFAGVPTFLPLGDGAKLVVLAADGWMGGGPVTKALTFGHDEGNQENARSLVGMVQHGAFRYHFGGDLTGAGTEKAPDIETPLVKHVAPKHWHKHGVDVAHAHHHARKTSNNKALIDALSPKDGKSRNVVAGISSLHVGSPQDEVVKAWTEGGRLGKGRFWVTETTFTSAKPKDFPAIIDAEGDVLLRTVQAGVGYWMQAPEVGVALAYQSARHGE